MAGLLGLLIAARPASAQVRELHLETRLVFYGDNAEFSNPFRTGATVLGTYGVVFLEADVSERLAVRAGGFGNWRFGSSAGIDQGRPVLALVIRGDRAQVVLGTLDTTRHVTGQGPDRTGPHGLLPPMQRETLAFERAHESGLQWIVDAPRYTQDAWINWQRLNTASHREIFDVGIATRTRLRPDLALRADLHVVHQGGQNGGAPAPVADSVAAAVGIEAGGPVGRLDRMSVEIAGVGSRNVVDRQRPDATKRGLGTLLRLGFEDAGWRAHVLMWRADDYVKVEGDPLYQSVRRDGTTYRGLRDYAEAGLSRRFDLAPEAFVETSLRFHRAEHHYGYSFRVVGVANLRWKLR